MPVFAAQVEQSHQKSAAPRAKSNAAAASVSKPALAISAPGDIHEIEADSIADQVMRMPEPKLQRACAAADVLRVRRTSQRRYAPPATTPRGLIRITASRSWMR